MRIGLNATPYNDRPSGARQRFVGIYGALIRRRPDWSFIIYEPVDCSVGTWFGDAPNVVVRRTPIASTGRLQRVIRGATYWPKALREDRLDLYENFVLPVVRARDVPTVLTIHDVRMLYDRVGLAGRMVRHHVVHQAFDRSDHIITVSDAVRNEILAFHPSARVSTIYNGVDATLFAASPEMVTQARAHYGLPPRHLLTVGHLEARKNLLVLLDAVALLRDRGMRCPLAIVGNDGGMRDAIAQHIATRDLGDLVTLIEGADDATIRALYAGCDMLAFPSRYEGFGIPILEAMAAGKPMVLADTPVFRELALDGALYFPVDDPGAAATAIATVWGDARERARQCEIGARRVRDFAFDHLADGVAALYEALA